MWITIIGPGGSAKNVVADLLVKERFEDLRQPFTPKPDLFVTELEAACLRLETQLKASSYMERRDVVTVRSFWDSNEVYIPITHERLEISPYEKEVLRAYYIALTRDARSLTPPHAVIYMKTTQMAASDRMKLRGFEPNADRLKRELELYEAMSLRVKVPLLEVDGTKSPEVIKHDLEFQIASLKVSNLSGGIWQKEFFR